MLERQKTIYNIFEGEQEPKVVRNVLLLLYLNLQLSIFLALPIFTV